LVVIPAKRLGPILEPSSGSPTHRWAWGWLYNWTETSS